MAALMKTADEEGRTVARTVDPARHEARRLSIIAAAARCFARSGFDATTIADICAEAGIGSGTFFHYFATKRSVLHALFALDAQEQAQRASAALDLADPVRGVWQLVDGMAADAGEREYLGLIAVAIHEVGRDEALAALIGGAEQQTRTALGELIGRCAAAGAADPGVAAQVAAGWVQALVDALYLRVAGDESLSAAAEASVLRTIVERFLRCPPP
jgi:AcrR family transcriptional regulator